MGNPENYYSHETAVIDFGAIIGKGTKIWHFTHIMSGAKIGNNCSLGQNVYVGSRAIIGNNVKIQNNVSIYDAVEISDDVFCGPSCVFTNVINPRAAILRKNEYKVTKVEKGVTIGANATIVCGITLGCYSFIGAGAVVTKDVKPFALMTGVPAKQKGWVSRNGIVLGEDLTCPETGEKYKLVNDNLILENEQ
ncbi:MAG: N-acetyltransferase [Prolixibacteraceae bacterium]|nr:N-acetyltransferase [Prolixibacteraceae bacterium]